MRLGKPLHRWRWALFFAAAVLSWLVIPSRWSRLTDELDLIKQVIRNDYTYYQSKTHSVQGFADRLNTVGTTYVEDEQKTWVGCPLVVHRRCISPMFELSNALSYNHMMKQQTALPGPEKEAKFCRRSSGWINVSGSENSRAGKDHFVETQGRKSMGTYPGSISAN